MAVMKMALLTLIGPKEEMTAAARRLMLCFQPVPIDAIVNDAAAAHMSTDAKNPYTPLLASLSDVKHAGVKHAGQHKPLPDLSPCGACSAVERDFTLTYAQMKVSEITEKLEAWKKKKAALEEEAEMLRAYQAALNLLGEENMRRIASRSADSAAHALKFSFLFVTQEQQKRIREACSADGTPILMEEICKCKNGDVKHAEQSCVMVVDFCSEAAGGTALAKQAELKSLDIGAVCADADLLSQKIAENKRALCDLAAAEERDFAEHGREYDNLYSQIYSMQRIYDACIMRGEFSGMFVVSGWIPESMTDEAEAYRDSAPNTTFIISEAEEVHGVPVPIKLKNNAVVRAFQEIVAMYSMPAYGEMDPSFVVAVTFVLFFGLMFGDIGHGLLIILGVTLMMKRGIMGRGLARVMQFAGASSMIFGALYGSIFGFEDVIPALWLSPMHDSNTLIAYAICVGVCVVTLGMMINMAAQFKAHNYGRMLFDGGGMAGLLFYLTLVGVAVAAVTGHAALISPMMIFAGVMLLVMLFKETLAHALLKEEGGEGIVMSFFEIIHNLLSFVSNTASFVRLAAFALNHVGLSIAVMMLADMVKDAPGGIVFKTIVLIIGNLLIVGLEGLIVFIQTLRLEYYEFFSKFYHGGGREFKPVSW